MFFESWWFVGFNLLILFLLGLDLGVLRREDRPMSIKQALVMSVVWIVVALIFNGWVWHRYGAVAGQNFLAGYLLERALSVDNLFVFLMIFSYFRVPAAYQYKVLFWGILGALFMRSFFIGVGALLIKKFIWTTYILGAFLVWTGIKMAYEDDEDIDLERNPVLRFARKFLPICDGYREGKFFVWETGKILATPLFLVLVVTETTDVVFAVDSIPAVFGITQDEFVVYTSNVFAILGLRALYFALAGVMQLFHYLQQGLSLILVFVGVKMLAQDFYHVGVSWALAIIFVILMISVILSVMYPPAQESHLVQELTEKTEKASPNEPEEVDVS